MSEPTREEALFQAAAQLSGADRSSFLNGACHGDRPLRQRLDALLAAHEAKDSILEPGEPNLQRGPFNTIKVSLAPDPADEAVGKTIGRYKVLEKVGEGGCGVVYVAEQTEPVRRRVALKVIKLGMDTKAVVARFEAERQALAMMDHPNIAKVLDAGTTENGRPFFIMELVRGIRITDYCDQNHLSTKERLDLFIKVCQAIQHAHQKGIIHRDIKPSNILVTLHDGVPVPKVIDFGIAKATEGRLTDATVYTQLHQFIGTPAYMSPEQAEMSGLDIDTRSDIYSLGVLLYELLTGLTPFDAGELMASGLDGMRKTIREQEPIRPSTRFATLEGEELTTTAKRRSTEVSKLTHQLKGDLDWIVMKCLEKDRTRRYETANGLAADLKRHLNNETVVARPPSSAYRFQKLVRRNKMAFSAGVAIAAALLLGIIAATSQAIRATHAKQEAVAARQQAEVSEKEALAAQANESRLRKQADAARSQSEDLVRFMLLDLQPALKDYGRLSLLKQVDEKTVDYFSALPPELRTPATGLAEAYAVSELADILHDSGNNEAARAKLKESLALYQKLAQTHPELPEAAVGVLKGEWALFAPKSSADLDTFQQDMLRRWRELLARFPDNPNVREGFGGALWLRASFAAQRFNKPKDAIAAALELEERLRSGMQAEPDNKLLPADYANCLGVLAIAYEAAGQKDKAVQETEEAEVFYDKALKEDPGNLRLLADAANAARNLSYRVSSISQKRARDAELIARERYHTLTSLDPANTDWQYDFAMSHMMECYYLESTGEIELARTALKKFDSLIQNLSLKQWDRHKPAANSIGLAELAAWAGDESDARSQLAIGESRFQVEYDKLPDAPFDRVQARIRWMNDKLEVVCALHDWPGLESLAHATLAAIDDGLALRPDDSELRLRRAVAQAFLGSALLGQNNPADAVTVLEQSVEGYNNTPPVMSYDENRDEHFEEAKAWLASALAQTGNRGRARSIVESVVADWDTYARLQPENWSCKEELSKNLVLLASLFDPVDSVDSARRQSLLDRATAILTAPGSEGRLTVDDKETLAKIKSLEAPTGAKVKMEIKQAQ